jgi:hypothetical protein
MVRKNKMTLLINFRYLKRIRFMRIFFVPLSISQSVVVILTLEFALTRHVATVNNACKGFAR